MKLHFEEHGLYKQHNYIYLINFLEVLMLLTVSISQIPSVTPVLPLMKSLREFYQEGHKVVGKTILLPNYCLVLMSHNQEAVLEDRKSRYFHLMSALLCGVAGKERKSQLHCVEMKTN